MDAAAHEVAAKVIHFYSFAREMGWPWVEVSGSGSEMGLHCVAERRITTQHSFLHTQYFDTDTSYTMN